jgi:hypothetical protein
LLYPLIIFYIYHVSFKRGFFENKIDSGLDVPDDTGNRKITYSDPPGTQDCNIPLYVLQYLSG